MAKGGDPHFNTAAEITEHSKRAMDRLMERGIIIRNRQSCSAA